MSNQTPGIPPDDEPSHGGESMPELPPLASGPIHPAPVDPELPPPLLPPQLGQPVESTPLPTPYLATGLPQQTPIHSPSQSQPTLPHTNQPILPAANDPLLPPTNQPILPSTAGQLTPSIAIPTPTATPIPTPAAIPVPTPATIPIPTPTAVSGAVESPSVGSQPFGVTSPSPAAPANLPPQAIQPASATGPKSADPRQLERTAARSPSAEPAAPRHAGAPTKAGSPELQPTPPHDQSVPSGRSVQPGPRPQPATRQRTSKPVPPSADSQSTARQEDTVKDATPPKQRRSSAKTLSGSNDRVERPVSAEPTAAVSSGSRAVASDARRAPKQDAKQAIDRRGVQKSTLAPAVDIIEPTIPHSQDLARRERGFQVLLSTPPWMISSLIHMCLLMALALFYVSEAVDVLLVIVVEQSEEVGDQLVSEVLVIPSLNASDVPDLEVALSANEVDNPLAAKRKLEIELEDFEPELAAADAPTTGAGLDGRKKGAKRALLAAYGGTGDTEDSVRLGLEWLKRNQQRDGSWSLEGPYENGGSFENKPAAIAMALLAFQGAGNTHKEGDFRSSVERGLQALLRLQDLEGTVLRHVRVENHRLYTQAQATIALCELYGMTQDEALRKPAQLALDYAVKIQADDGQGGGGWRYMPGQYVDTSVTGWFVMALQSGKMAGLDVPQSALDKVSRYLDHVTDDGVNYQYMPDYDPSVVMTAEALLCRQYLGWTREDPRLNAGVKQILRQPIDWSQRDVYYWYYATQVLHHMGREPWDQWNLVMRKTLPLHQETSGRKRGSWSPIGDGHGSEGGRLYTTCFCLYMLEVYYRHLPIYR